MDKNNGNTSHASNGATTSDDVNLRTTRGKGFPLPLELTVQVLQEMDTATIWAFSRTCKSIYTISRNRVLFQRVKLGPGDYKIGLRWKIPLKKRKLFSEDVRSLEVFNVGHFVRILHLDLKQKQPHGLGFRLPEWGEEKSEELVKSLHALRGLMPNVRELSINERCEAVVALESFNCIDDFPQLEEFKFLWKYSGSPKEPEDLNLTSTPKYLKRLIIKVEIEAPDYEEYKVSRGYFQDLNWFHRKREAVENVVSQLHRALSQTIEVLAVWISFNWKDETQTIYPSVPMCISPNQSSNHMLKVLSYHTDCVPDTSPNLFNVCRSISRICSIFSNLEMLVLELPPAELPQSVWNMTSMDNPLREPFSLLKNCRILQLEFKVDNQTRDMSSLSEIELKISNLEWRRSIMGGVAEVMPSLEQFLWKHLPESIGQSDCMMTVERSCAKGRITRLSYVAHVCDWSREQDDEERQFTDSRTVEY